MAKVKKTKAGATPAATVQLSGRDCAMVFREHGEVELVMVPRDPDTVRKDGVSEGEAVMMMFSSLLRDSYWMEMTIQRFNGVNGR